jgi:mono/diheme cytochrome c family protein
MMVLASHAHAETACAMRADLAGNLGLSWADLRAACYAEQVSYKQKNSVGFHWFVNAGNGFTGVPYVLQRLLPELAPEIWGQPDENFSRFGLFRDAETPNRPLPRGLGITSTAGRPVNADGEVTGEIDFAQPGLHVVTLACGACHTGQVRTDVGNKIIDGAPNTQIDVRKWREAYNLTVAKFLGDSDRIKVAAQQIASLIDSKPEGWFYPTEFFGGPSFRNFSPTVEAGQRAVVKANLVAILASFACNTVERAEGITLQQRTSYGNWNSPGMAGFSTGQQDGSGDLVFQLLVANTQPKGECQVRPDGTLVEKFDAQTFLNSQYPEIPPFATVTDIPSVWNQQARDLAQWDGSVKNSFWRNIAAQLPIVNDPIEIDLHNTGIVANFLSGLPPAPYPFDVDMTRAVRGELLFKENCSVCHKAHNDTLYQFRDIGTDLNRASVLNEEALKLFIAGFAASCNTPDFHYKGVDGNVVYPCKMTGDEVIVGRTNPSNSGYVTSVLDGVWARAPYLHNGSIPTLYHLLVPSERPKQFLRGSIDFDRNKVGFAWDIAETGRFVDIPPTLMVYDTSRDGHSNAGHDRDVFVDGKIRRRNWSDPKYVEQVKDLIEYLKTQ